MQGTLLGTLWMCWIGAYLNGGLFLPLLFFGDLLIPVLLGHFTALAIVVMVGENII